MKNKKPDLLEVVKSIRITKKMYNVLSDVAEKEDRSFSAECVRRLRRTLIEEGYSPSKLE